MNDKYHKKYLKYKNKYLKLMGGANKEKGNCGKWRDGLTEIEKKSICINERTIKNSSSGFWNCKWENNKCVDNDNKEEIQEKEIPRPRDGYSNNFQHISDISIKSAVIQKLIELIKYFRENPSTSCDLINVITNQGNKEIQWEGKEKKQTSAKVKEYVINHEVWLKKILTKSDQGHLIYIKKKKKNIICFATEFMKDYLLYLLENVLMSDNEIDKIYAIGIIFIGFSYLEKDSIRKDNEYLNYTNNAEKLIDESNEDRLKINTGVLPKLEKILEDHINGLINTRQSDSEILIETIKELLSQIKKLFNDNINAQIGKKIRSKAEIEKKIRTLIETAEKKQASGKKIHANIHEKLQKVKNKVRFMATVEESIEEKKKEEAQRKEEEARRKEEEARIKEEKELKKANERRDKFVRDYSVNKIKEEMEKIIKKIKKIIKEQDPEIDVEDLRAKKGNVVTSEGKNSRKPLVRQLAQITDWTNNTKENLIEKAQKHDPNEREDGVRYKDFIDNVIKFKKILPELSEQQKKEKEDNWKKLYNDSKTYAEENLWWREVFLENIRS